MTRLPERVADELEIDGCSSIDYHAPVAAVAVFQPEKTEISALVAAQFAGGYRKEWGANEKAWQFSM